MSRLLDDGPFRRLLRGQMEVPLSLSRAEQWRDLYWMSADALPGETDAHDLYVRLALMARSLGQPDIASIYDEIAKDEADHYHKINYIILPKLFERTA